MTKKTVVGVTILVFLIIVVVAAMAALRVRNSFVPGVVVLSLTGESRGC